MPTTDTLPILSLAHGPSFAWSFEETDAFAFEIHNPGLPELADEKALVSLRYTADVHQGGKLARRVALAPLPAPVPIGERRVFQAHLGATLIGGDYELEFGLARDGGGCNVVPIPVRAERAPLRVKNQIMDAFVELINACNFRCTFCPQTTLKRKQRAMDFELATKVVGDLAAMGHHHPIMVHLLGEPLLYPRFFDFVEMAHGMGQRVHLLTNGSRFEDKTIEGIFRTGLDELLISLNTPEKATYEAQRGTSMPFEKYMAGIKRMVVEAVRRGPPPKLLIQILYEPSRTDHPEEIARVNALSNEWANLVREVKGLPHLRVEEVQHFTPPFTIVELCDSVSIQYMPYHSWGEGQSLEKHFCSYPWRQLAVLVDGQATACCVDAEGEICLGNAREQSVEEIWEGPVLTRMRHAFWNDLQAVEPRCVRCPIRHWDIEKLYRTHALA